MSGEEFGGKVRARDGELSCWTRDPELAGSATMMPHMPQNLLPLRLWYPQTAQTAESESPARSRAASPAASSASASAARRCAASSAAAMESALGLGRRISGCRRRKNSSISALYWGMSAGEADGTGLCWSLFVFVSVLLPLFLSLSFSTKRITCLLASF